MADDKIRFEYNRTVAALSAEERRRESPVRFSDDDTIKLSELTMISGPTRKVVGLKTESVPKRILQLGNQAIDRMIDDHINVRPERAAYLVRDRQNVTLTQITECMGRYFTSPIWKKMLRSPLESPSGILLLANDKAVLSHLHALFDEAKAAGENVKIDVKEQSEAIPSTKLPAEQYPGVPQTYGELMSQITDYVAQELGKLAGPSAGLSR